MSKKKKQEQQEDKQVKDEKVLNFEDIKEMTVGQVVRKQQDLEDGVEEDDNILDRYIKQHRDDIEAEKFETLVNVPVISEEQIEEVEAVSESDDLTEPVEEVQASPQPELQIHKVNTAEKEEAETVVPPAPVTNLENAFEDDLAEQEKSGKKKRIIWLGLAAAFVAILATAFVWMSNMNSNQTKPSSSSSASETSTSSSLDPNVTAFEKLYASFFTDSSQTKLKNSEFGKLNQLKEALDKIGSSNDGYKAAKAKYDVLEKAIKSIQDINGKFDKDAIVNGELDTTANVKENATFESVSTGLSAVDTLLTSAINMGKTQTPASSAPPAQGQDQGQTGGNVASPAPAPSAPVATPDPAPSAPAEVPGGSAPSTNPGWVVIDGVVYGMEIPPGLTLQRELSRVPYNQAAIDDVNNEAWIFNPGILEKIIKIAQERGHITGNNYYLEKVNIINGRGYYNLFQPDGTYLFSINCKTGYFVGNAPGRADDLDF